MMAYQTIVRPFGPAGGLIDAPPLPGYTQAQAEANAEAGMRAALAILTGGYITVTSSVVGAGASLRVVRIGA